MPVLSIYVAEGLSGNLDVADLRFRMQYRVCEKSPLVQFVFGILIPRQVFSRKVLDNDFVQFWETSILLIGNSGKSEDLNGSRYIWSPSPENRHLALQKFDVIIYVYKVKL